VPAIGVRVDVRQVSSRLQASPSVGRTTLVEQGAAINLAQSADTLAEPVCRGTDRWL